MKSLFVNQASFDLNVVVNILGPVPQITYLKSWVTSKSVVLLVTSKPQLQYSLTIDSYRVWYKLANGTGRSVIHTVQPSDNIIVDDLVPGKAYTIKVAYISGTTVGPFSSSIVVTTKSSGMLIMKEPHV